jgi:hypothetical protein
MLARAILVMTCAAALFPPCASAAGPPSPIVVSETVTYNGDLYPWARTRGPNNVTATFKNVSSQTIRDVMFVVFDENGIVRGRIEDKGTFAPGITIKHVFENCYDGVAPLQAALVPIAATFADGSSWHGPDAYDFARLSCPTI